MSFSIEDMFDRIALDYDRLNAILSLGMDRHWRKEAVRELSVLPGDEVLDLCCGSGDLAHEIAISSFDSERPIRVTGVDFSAKMLDLCQQKYPQVKTLRSDVLEMPLEADSFEGCTLAFGPRNIQDLNALWQEMKRVVKPGGRVVCLELSRPKNPFLAWGHRFYLNTIVPFVGGLISGDFEAYRYLSRSIQGFLDPDELASSMKAAGLLQVQYRPLSGGIVAIHSGVVPE